MTPIAVIPRSPSSECWKDDVGISTKRTLPIDCLTMTPNAVIPRNEGVSLSDVGTSMNRTLLFTPNPPDSHVLPLEGLRMT